MGTPTLSDGPLFGISIPFYVSSQIFPITTSIISSTIYQIPIMTPHDLGVFVYHDHIFNRVCDPWWGVCCGTKDTWRMCLQS